MSTQTPLVSIITPFLNGGDWLRQAVESVVTQTYENWQHILIDDGSGTEATAIAKEYCQKYPGKFIYTEHPGHINLGVTSSRNQGIRHAAGELVAFLDSDDCWLPDKLKNQVDIYNEHTEAGMICEASRYWFSWENPASKDLVVKVGAEGNKLYEPPQLIYTLYPFGKGAAPCPSGMIMKKSLLDEIGRFEESFKGPNQVYEDQAFLCKIYLAAPVYISSEANNLYRQRAGSLMESISQKKQYFKVRSYFLKWMENYLDEKRIYDPKLIRMLRNAKIESNNPDLYLFLSRFKSRIQKLLNISNQ